MPKRPRGHGWEKVGGEEHVSKVEPGCLYESWLHPELGLFAISAVEVHLEPDLMLPNSTLYQLSVSLLGERCDDAEAQIALADFGLLTANEATYHSAARVRRFAYRVC
jgi:hypothetical protein